MSLKKILVAAAAATLMTGAAQAQTAVPAQTPTDPAGTPPAASQVKAAGDIVATVQAAGQFKTFLKAAEATNLTGVLKTNKNLTVFAPTDAAFAALPAGELDRLMLPENRQQLQQLLTYHIVNAPVDSTKIKGKKGPVPTVAGSNLVLDGSGDTLMANNATIVQADVQATNGTLHVVDKVLSPTTAASTPPATASAETGAAAGASATAPAASNTDKAGARPAAKGN